MIITVTFGFYMVTFCNCCHKDCHVENPLCMSFRALTESALSSTFENKIKRLTYCHSSETKLFFFFLAHAKQTNGSANLLD